MESSAREKHQTPNAELEKELAVLDPTTAALKKPPSALNGATVSVPPTSQEILNADLDFVEEWVAEGELDL